MPSWKGEVTTDDVKWDSNTLRFRTTNEALQYVQALAARWTLVRNYRVVPCNDPVTHVFHDGRAYSLTEVPLNLISSGLSKE